MGGGGGLDPISVISSVVFGAVKAAATSGQSRAETTIVADDGSAEAELEAAEERRRAARKKTEAELLANARQAERAELASRDAQAQTLGAPSVSGANLKEKLGQ
jgi:hypothetical protein